MSDKQVLGLIYGGKSSEHEVSLRTAFSILQAIDYDKWTVIPLYIQLDGMWVEGSSLQKPPSAVAELRLATNRHPDLLKLKETVDVVFPVVHGPYGEDGTLQGLLEMIDVPYVGSGVLGSSLGMDKVMMKRMFALHNLPHGEYLAYTRQEIDKRLESICTEIEAQLGYPVFVKPANLGSSVGINKAKNEKQLVKALTEAAAFDQKVIVEAFINGRELEIGVLGNDADKLQTSAVGEIVSAAEFYDYESKYKEGGAELFIPAKIPERVANEMAQLAKEAFLALDCAGLARVDFFWDEKEDQLYLNEINTMPGFTEYSMYPLLFKKTGVSYQELVETLIQLGLERFREKKKIRVIAPSLE
ncbi:D-alanine--D-alanine ligase [Caldalkalibacillus thermarum TA2.A1]|uniref:D-alanine--D-alanine ligase n=1 Tax=Caldalkalibacillus thermarum (strain TA2.A1) TaxID=986075 RepID=F5L7C6_CALTT|nr:D-alanine--D-alanine ligase [Caldalkalibacillus thermarum]EGL82718.1 D-alanine--D-alanine ligase [Caldalkalibacillus thermarum TA2.A1]QZT32580.1 D-alanine--D-alanine ligase [Caldalkalibacillus thermarum TA2.A1]